MRSARIVRRCRSSGGLFRIVLSAVARHRPGTMYLETVAQFLLFHAPVFLGLAGASRRLARPSQGGQHGPPARSGSASFCSAAISLRRDFLGQPSVAMAAPTGGTILMGGWLLIGIASLWRARA